MIYVTSDLHGYPLSKFKALLEKAGFGDDDFLLVLGDVIDRNSDGGVEVLRYLVAEIPNAQLILGNHEAMLLSVSDFLFDEVTDESLAKLDVEKLKLLNAWYANGAAPTVQGLKKLLKEEPEVLEGILDYLREAPLYDIVEVNGKMYILVHAGFENFRPDKNISEYGPSELLWARPTLNTRYFDNATVIFGHTPTEYFGSPGKIVKTDSWICIDTGAAIGYDPVLLRLDDMKEFY